MDSQAARESQREIISVLTIYHEATRPTI